MDVLIDQLRTLAADSLGLPDESPLDPGVEHRATALRALGDLLQEDPSMVRPGVRRTIETQVLEALPGDVTPRVGPRGAAVLRRHGWDGPVGVAEHLRLLDRLAAAIVHDVWDLSRVGSEVVLGDDMSAEHLATVLGLHAFEVEAAASRPDPDPEYFLRRPGMTEDERRATLAMMLEHPAP